MKKLISAALLGAFLLVFATSHKARAEGPEGEVFQEHPGHEKGHDVYQNWMRPDVPTSGCCDEKIWHDSNGYKWSTGHCYETDAKIVSGEWVVKLDNGMWVKVPNIRVLGKVPSPNPARPHVCENYSSTPKDPILCFREPVGGT